MPRGIPKSAPRGGVRLHMKLAVAGYRSSAIETNPNVWMNADEAEKTLDEMYENFKAMLRKAREIAAEQKAVSA